MPNALLAMRGGNFPTNTNMNTPITNSSVRVMRSHDYCHFEVVLGTTETATPEDVDELRKTAARLVDKAVNQFKIAKRNAENLISYRRDIELAERIRAIPEGERSVDDKAYLKAFDDGSFVASRRYDYEEDWHSDDDDY